MKKFFFYSIFMTLLILQSLITFSQQGKIFKVEDGELFTITIKGHAKQDLWVGCTVNPDTHNEVDLKPQQVSEGNFSVSFNLSASVAGSLMQGNYSVPYVVALWEDKISLKKCEKKYGKGSEKCKWARKNKYQMEGRVDRYSGSYIQ